MDKKKKIPIGAFLKKLWKEPFVRKAAWYLVEHSVIKLWEYLKKKKKKKG
jgi:hypothetical protein